MLASLFSVEPDLLVTSLVLARTIYQVPVCDLFSIRPPCVRKDSIFGNIIADEVLGQAEVTITIAL
jgi:hypothetical protein